MPDFVTGAGTTFSLAAAQPATYTGPGYVALTWVPVGKLTNIGDVPDRVYEIVSLNYVASAGTDKAKGNFALGSQTLTMAIDTADTGQILLNTATNSTARYSIKIAHASLGTIYAQALVMGGPKTYGDGNTAATRQVTIEYTIVSATETGLVVV